MFDIKGVYKKNEEKRQTKITEDLENVREKYCLDFSKDIRKTFNDPIHGQIELHPLLVKIIDTPQFQRLRYIKQLGTKYLVYPGATHTRFEHSLGVAHLAGCLLKTLHENQPELNITKQDFLCVQIAALCHDMGHGPFSHLFDAMFIPEVRPGKPWTHEQASVDMFRCMRKKNGLYKEMERYGLNLPEDITFIEELILKGQKDGQWSMKGRTEDKSFLYEIVANKVNGIDVDKWDYLARDCYYLGIPCGFDSQRLLKSARVCNVNERKHICFRDKVADNIYGMFHTRYTLHRQALQHKIGYIIDVKIKDALVQADEKMMMSKAIDDMSKYTELTDRVFDEILHTSDSHPNLVKAKGILEEIVERKLPKFVGEARLKEDELKEELKKNWETVIDRSLTAEDFEICVLDMGFGEVGKEPIDNVHFYSKNDPNKAFKMEKYQVSSLKPKRFHEYLVRVYYNKTDGSYQEVQQKAEESFHEWCKKNKFIDSDVFS
ncbi:deoxynucleoside triphosphate triphosphohydrolase SAMHD1-like [Sinocyclocheilus grahami]|uniref:deoxynucleoside triphosphate triphosphohydrolase SAMHD1-like n=1 Tax=Sinocyclocheilus grahami TaxID=75366 RepID=UPI0007AD5472|nr:PREDICTED: deoxynucleoside triphosphate triphosphohydrolase SAMHD1-like [Sinocyclocheilus grahami]